MAGTLAMNVGACAATFAVARINALLASTDTDRFTKEILQSTRRVLSADASASQVYAAEVKAPLM
ncbi:hypothetical protein NBRC116601_32100 [Cognatishimia sp. WU-CL00825]|uniref:hypothetical protein n=1 Tax=Cognatishimia sp. WU-CL00825 TaxID=3127658 RepID=UPI003105EF2F